MNVRSKVTSCRFGERRHRAAPSPRGWRRPAPPHRHRGGAARSQHRRGSGARCPTASTTRGWQPPPLHPSTAATPRTPVAPRTPPSITLRASLLPRPAHPSARTPRAKASHSGARSLQVRQEQRHRIRRTDAGSQHRQLRRRLPQHVREPLQRRPARLRRRRMHRSLVGRKQDTPADPRRHDAGDLAGPLWYIASPSLTTPTRTSRPTHPSRPPPPARPRTAGSRPPGP